MYKGKIVRVRLRRDTDVQPAWVMVGKVIDFTDYWVTVEGKGITVFRRKVRTRSSMAVRGLRIVQDDPDTGQMVPAMVDEEPRTVVVPRDNINNVRILPDDFDLNNIRIVVSGQRVDLVVDGAPNSPIDELTE